MGQKPVHMTIIKLIKEKYIHTYIFEFHSSSMLYASLVLEKNFFFNFINTFSLFLNYLPFGPLLEQTWKLCAKFGWNLSSGSWEENITGKRLQTELQTDRRTDGRTDERRSKKQLSWAKKIQAIFSVISSWWKHKKK